MKSCVAGRRKPALRLAAMLAVTAVMLSAGVLSAWLPAGAVPSAAVLPAATSGAAEVGVELQQPGQQQPEQQGEWQRVTPETAALQEQLPATPFVLYAYGFVWVATLAYLWSIWRRITRVRREIQQLERRVSPGGGRR